MKTAISLLAFVGLVTFGFQLLVSRSVSGSLFLASLAMMTRVSLRGRKLVFLIAGVAGLLVASRQVPLTPQISSLPTMLAALSLLAINIHDNTDEFVGGCFHGCTFRKRIVSYTNTVLISVIF